MAELILIVDDEPVQRRLLEATIQKFGYRTMTADGGTSAIEALTGKHASRITAIVLDVMMPDMDGIEVLEAMRKKGLKQPVIVQTAKGGVETAVNAMRAGAVDFVMKPAAPERLKVSLKNALKLDALKGEIKRINRASTGKLTFKEIISASPNMERVKKIATKAAESNIPVLIEGESGVGKEMIARAIQGMSDRASKSFVTVNCGALPENLAESILFGHEKGAFTGATDKHLGKFQEADGGTLFLDEVGELPLELQVKLLRAIQEGEVDPVGASKPVKVNFRLISATNRNLIDEVNEGNFREDLYYRLSVLPLMVPPLRDRREDIPELVRHFVARIGAEEGRNISGVDQDTMEMLCAFDWPGNIRQLENAVFRAVVLSESDELGMEEFPQIASSGNAGSSHEGNTGKLASPAPAASPVIPEVPLTGPEPGFLNLFDKEGNVISLAEAESEVIRFAVDHYDGQLSRVSRKLGIGRSTLYRKLREYGLETAGEGEDA